MKIKFFTPFVFFLGVLAASFPLSASAQETCNLVDDIKTFVGTLCDPASTDTTVDKNFGKNNSALNQLRKALAKVAKVSEGSDLALRLAELQAALATEKDECKAVAKENKKKDKPEEDDSPDDDDAPVGDGA